MLRMIPTTFLLILMCVVPAFAQSLGGPPQIMSIYVCDKTPCSAGNAKATFQINASPRACSAATIIEWGPWLTRSTTPDGKKRFDYVPAPGDTFAFSCATKSVQ
jgi:hypothetical protein